MKHAPIARALGGASLCLAIGLGALACGGGSSDLQVTNVEPRAGATAGEQPVRILGNGFRRDIGYTVYFGTKRAERSTILDDHTLLVASPTQDDPGPVDVIVAADNGPAFRVRQGFTYQEQGGNVMEHVGDTSGQGHERF